MQRDQIRSVLKNIFEAETGSELTILSLSDGVILAEEFKLDSIDMVSLMMQVEGQFRVRMTHQELADVSTVGSLIDLVAAKVAQNQAVIPPLRAAA
jgi:acyl carrier protein